jgi:hypothetical protein
MFPSFLSKYLFKSKLLPFTLLGNNDKYLTLSLLINSYILQCWVFRENGNMAQPSLTEVGTQIVRV